MFVFLLCSWNFQLLLHKLFSFLSYVAILPGSISVLCFHLFSIFPRLSGFNSRVYFCHSFCFHFPSSRLSFASSFQISSLTIDMIATLLHMYPFNRMEYNICFSTRRS